MKVVLVGRHSLLPAQERALRELGMEVVEQVAQIDDPRKFVEELQDVEGIVIQVLPLSLLAQMLPLAKKRGIKIFMFEQGKAKIFDSEEEAKRFVEEAPDRRVMLASPTDNIFRVVEFTGVAEVKNIKIETEKVWP